MSNQTKQLADDVAFLRALADGTVHLGERDGAMLAALGTIFSLVALQYWAIDSRLVAAPASWRPWLWLDGLAPFLATLFFIEARARSRAPGPGSRAISAAWTGLGVALSVAVAALMAAGWRLGQPQLAAGMFPIVLFTLLGASWGVAFAVKRQAALALVGAGCGVAAIACGALVGAPAEWLALAAGLALLVAAPGFAILAAARGA